VNLVEFLDCGLWVCLSSCNGVRPTVEVRQVGLNFLTFRWISSFNPPMKQLIRNGSLKLEACVACFSNSVWYFWILPTCCNFARASADLYTPLARSGLKEPWRILARLPWGSLPSPIDTTEERPLPNKRKQCEHAALPGFGGIQRIASPCTTILTDRRHRSEGSQGVMPECEWSHHVAPVRGYTLYRSCN
jgi:hypothetical protein